MFAVRLELLNDRRPGVIGNRILSRCDDIRANQFRPIFEFRQDGSGRAFIPASRRDFANDSRAVAILGQPRSRLDNNSLRTVVANDQSGGLLFPVAIDSSDERLALSLKSLCPFGNRFRERLLSQ